jgi:hypothetical protein
MASGSAFALGGTSANATAAAAGIEAAWYAHSAGADAANPSGKSLASVPISICAGAGRAACGGLPAGLALAALTLAEADSGALPTTPNGLAELASVISGDLRFEDIFNAGSRRSSVGLGVDELGAQEAKGAEHGAAALVIVEGTAAQGSAVPESAGSVGRCVVRFT